MRLCEAAEVAAAVGGVDGEGTDFDGGDEVGVEFGQDGPGDGPQC